MLGKSGEHFGSRLVIHIKMNVRMGDFLAFSNTVDDDNLLSISRIIRSRSTGGMCKLIFSKVCSRLITCMDELSLCLK